MKPSNFFKKLSVPHAWDGCEAPIGTSSWSAHGKTHLAPGRMIDDIWHPVSRWRLILLNLIISMRGKLK